MIRRRVQLNALRLALLLSLMATLFLAVGPVYHMVEVTAAQTGEVVGEISRTSSSLITENGRRVFPIILFPVFVTSLALLATVRAGTVSRNRWVLWSSGISLLLLCMVAIASIGLLYLPTALLLLFSASVAPRRAHTA